MSLHLGCDEAINLTLKVQLACTAIEVERDRNQYIQNYQNWVKPYTHNINSYAGLNSIEIIRKIIQLEELISTLQS